MTRPECGTEPGYGKHLRRGEPTCAPCRAAHSRYTKRNKRFPRNVDAAVCERHVRYLLSCGMTLSSICAAAGVNEETVTFLRAGRRKVVRRTTAEALLRVEPNPEPTALVDATGTRRRIRALLALGHRHTEITAAAGGHYSNVTLHQEGDKVTKAVADAFRMAYDRLSMTPGTSQLTAARAKRNGYAPPLAWDDDTIDDPNAQPATDLDTDEELIDEVVVEKLMRPGFQWRQGIAGRMPTRAERLEAARRLLATIARREAQRAYGIPEQWIDGEGKDAITKRLGLKWERDVVPMLDELGRAS